MPIFKVLFHPPEEFGQMKYGILHSRYFTFKIFYIQEFSANNGRDSPFMSIKLPILGLNSRFGTPIDCANPICVIPETMWLSVNIHFAILDPKTPILSLFRVPGG